MVDEQCSDYIRYVVEIQTETREKERKREKHKAKKHKRGGQTREIQQKDTDTTCQMASSLW